MLALWLRIRALSIADFVKEVREVLRDVDKGILLGADLFYPSISWMVGQDYRLLGKYLDIVKPMIYTKRMGSWETTYAKEMVDILGVGFAPRIINFISTHWRVEIPTDIETLADEGFPHYIAHIETKKARLLLPPNVKLYTGLYSSRIKGMAMTKPEDIEEASKYAITAGADGLYFCAYRDTPQENFESIRRVKHLLSRRVIE